MKYIMFRCVTKDSLVARYVPILFPDFMVHAEVARHMFTPLMESNPEWTVSIISAGEFSSTQVAVLCHGGSETLGVLSRGKADSDVIRAYDYLHGI